MSYYTGNAGKVTIDGTELAVKEWSAEHSVDGLDVTVTTSNGKRQMQKGNEQLTFKMSAFFDATNNPESVAGIKPGATDIAVTLYAKGTASATFTITKALILKASIKSAVDGIVEYDIEGHANEWT